MDSYNFVLLHKVKRNICLMKAFSDEILEDIKILKLYKNVNNCASDYDFSYPACYIEKLTEERRCELKEFLFLL